MDCDSDHKLSIIAVLTAIEYFTVKHGGIRERSGLVMRELNKDPNTLLDRFVVLMKELEAEFKTVDVKGKIDGEQYNMIDSLIESWKKNGFSNQFNADVREFLFGKNGMPSYINNPGDRECLNIMANCFKISL